MPHTDHATWVPFTAEEMADLRNMLANGISYLDPARRQILDRLDHYESDEVKDPQFRAAAEDLGWVRDGECEVDDHAVVSASDDGAYVMAWVWVDRTDIEPDYVPTYLRDEEAAGGHPRFLNAHPENE
jgi:hypothetical protein